MSYYVTLLPCPFCGERLAKMSDGMGYLHPKKNCVLSDFHMEADGYSEERWNTRTAAEAASAATVAELVEAINCLLDDSHSYESEGMARDHARKVVARAKAAEQGVG